jgi:hypothetical protein
MNLVKDGVALLIVVYWSGTKCDLGPMDLVKDGVALLMFVVLSIHTLSPPLLSPAQCHIMHFFDLLSVIYLCLVCSFAFFSAVCMLSRSHRVRAANFDSVRLAESHAAAVTGVAFASGNSNVFATCALDGTVWYGSAGLCFLFVFFRGVIFEVVE